MWYPATQWPELHTTVRVKTAYGDPYASLLPGLLGSKRRWIEKNGWQPIHRPSFFAL